MPKDTNTDIEGDLVTLKSVDFPHFQPPLSGTLQKHLHLYQLYCTLLWLFSSASVGLEQTGLIMKADLDLVKQLFSRLSLSDDILLSFSKMLSN